MGFITCILHSGIIDILKMMVARLRVMGEDLGAT